MTGFKEIGAALRWLRTQRGKKQREVAKSAGITPAMLSAYETGKHRPSLDTTERVLGALQCDVVDLTNALQIVKASGDAFQAQQSGEEVEAPPTAPSVASIEERIHALLQQGDEGTTLSQQEEAVIVSLLSSLVQLMRYLKR